MRSLLMVSAGIAMLGLTAPAAAQNMPAPMHMMPHDGTLLTVVAEGRTTRTPDLATIRAGVTTQAATAAEALAQNSTRMERVLAALRRAGVAERDIQTASIQLNPQYRYQENEPPVITGYQAVNMVSVRFRDVAKSGSILDVLVREGANNINGPSLSLDDPAAALDEARRDAVARAAARAQLYASAAGLSVDRIVSISETMEGAGPQPPMMVSARAQSESADTAIVPGEQDVTVTLTFRFLLK